MTLKQPNVCVIGAGPCGLTTAKNLLQCGITQITVFESNSQLGGNWIFDWANNHSSVYETTHSISSRGLSQFEDFLLPWNYPDYPSHQQLLAYFNDYATHFAIKKFIKFNTTIIRANLLATTQWEVTYCDIDNIEHTTIFDYLFVANGHHWDPLQPNYGSKFNGEILHAHQYKSATPFKDKNVLVVGAGNSACDVAVEVSRCAKKVCISMRQGQAIFPKFILGKPTDIIFARLKWLPFWVRQSIASKIIRLIQGRYGKYHLQEPTTKALAQHPTINSELLYFIRHGKVLPRHGIKNITGAIVEFTDGSHDEFDTIIYATGYKISFPFFDSALIDFSTSRHIPLYLKMMHPNFDTLYFIGLFQPQGSIWPLADYQAKIAAQIISGKLQRPKNLSKKITQEMRISKRQFHYSTRHALEVDYHIFRRALRKELRLYKTKSQISFATSTGLPVDG